MSREESMITKNKTKSVSYEEPIQKKKKKKKYRVAANELVSEVQSHTEVEIEDLIKCKKKPNLAEEIVTDPGEELVAQSSIKKKKKKKKSKLKDENIPAALICEEDNEVGSDNLGQNCLVPMDESVESESFKKKRKNKKDKDVLLLTDERDQEELHMESSMLKKKKRTSTSQENVLINTSPETIERDTEEACNNNTKKKKKKKKTKKEKREIIQADLTESKTEKGECGVVEHNITSIHDKKKKKKKLNRTLDSEERTLSKDTVEVDKCTMKNSMKRPTPECTVPKEMSKSKKKKIAPIKQEALEEMEGDPDVEIVSVKKGNTDEVKIDKIRRQALQAEVDRESGKKKGVNVGQWQTATFDNPEQKMKFLRLMGGFKKSSQFTPLSPVATEKSNLALSRTGEETLKQNLLSEFEKAIDLKHNRGIGLGFQPATKKTFFIDKSRSTSIKFDD